MKWCAVCALLVMVCATPVAAQWDEAVRASRAVVRVEAAHIQPPGTASVGSGVCITPRHIISVAHLVVPLGNVAHVMVGGLGAKLVKIDTGSDLALLVTAPGVCRIVAVPAPGDVRIAQPVMVSGYAYGSPVRLSAVGTVASLPYLLERPGLGSQPMRSPALWMSVRSVPGMSGGGYFNQGGLVVGMHQATAGDAGFRVAVPTQLMQRFVTPLWDHR